jgi:hypothetical protein
MRDSNSGFADLVRIVRYDTRYASRCLALSGLELLTPRQHLRVDDATVIGRRPATLRSGSPACCDSRERW